MHKYAVFPLYLMIPPGKIATLKSHLYFFSALLKSPNTDFDNNSAEHPSGKFGLFRNYFSDCFYTYFDILFFRLHPESSLRGSTFLISVTQRSDKDGIPLGQSIILNSICPLSINHIHTVKKNIYLLSHFNRCFS